MLYNLLFIPHSVFICINWNFKICDSVFLKKTSCVNLVVYILEFELVHFGNGKLKILSGEARLCLTAKYLGNRAIPFPSSWVLKQPWTTDLIQYDSFYYDYFCYKTLVSSHAEYIYSVWKLSQLLLGFGILTIVDITNI